MDGGDRKKQIKKNESMVFSLFFLKCINIRTWNSEYFDRSFYVLVFITTNGEHIKVGD